MSEADQDEMEAVRYEITETVEVSCSEKGVVDVYQYDCDGQCVDLLSVSLETFRALAERVEKHYASAHADSPPSGVNKD